MVNAAYGLGFFAYFGAALSTATSEASALVPSIFPVSLDGKPYNIDFNNPMGGNFMRQDSIALLRTQADSARSAGESSVSPELFWRRSMDSWHLGCGQSHNDRDTSSPYRFRASKGMDVWNVGELRTLNATELEDSSGAPTGASNNFAVAAGSRLYVSTGQLVKFATTSWTWTGVTGNPSENVVGIASDGKNVWVAYPSAIYKTDTGSSSMSSMATAPAGVSITGVWFNKGKLFVAGNDAKLYQITKFTSHTINSGSPVDSPMILDKSTLGFSFTSSAGAGGFHYFGGYLGDKSLIYKSDLAADGVTLSAPIVAGELPDGELVYHLGAYLGYLIVGTNKGVRFCNFDQYGYLTIGGLIETGQPVYATEGQDRFVWFSWGNYDATSSGLGRMDLSQFTATLTPAYASDLMYTGLGNVLSVCTFNDLRVFTVSGAGLIVETASKVASASLESGLISHGIIDRKVAVFVDSRLTPLASGSVIQLSLAVDGGSYEVVGGSNIDNITATPEFYAGKDGRQFEIKVEFTNDVTCTGVLLRSYPAPNRAAKFTVPVMLFDSVEAGQRDWHGNPADDLAFLKGLHKAQLPFQYKEGDTAYTVVMDDYAWMPEKRSAISGFQGTFIATLREIL